MNINSYRMKDVSMADIIHELRMKHLPVNDGGLYINENAVRSTFKVLIEDISVNIAFPEDLSKWDDFDYVLVLDENWGQPYTPFYHDEQQFPFKDKVISKYNEFMNGLSFLEKKI